jgi:hypothetical protein
VESNFPEGTWTLSPGIGHDVNLTGLIETPDDGPLWPKHVVLK